MPVKALVVVMVAFVLVVAAHADEELGPDAELLEFLADWESGDGQWLEPSSFEAVNAEGEVGGNLPKLATQEGHDEH